MNILFYIIRKWLIVVHMNEIYIYIYKYLWQWFYNFTNMLGPLNSMINLSFEEMKIWDSTEFKFNLYTHQLYSMI